MPNSADLLSALHGPDHRATIVLRNADGHEQPLWEADGVELGQCASADGGFFTATTSEGKDLLLDIHGHVILAVPVGVGLSWGPGDQRLMACSMCHTERYEAFASGNVRLRQRAAPHLGS